MRSGRCGQLVVRTTIMVCLLVLCGSAYAALPSLIPQPAQVRVGQGSYAVDAQTAIHIAPGDKAAADAAHYLADLLTRTRGWRLAIREDATATSHGGIVLHSDAHAGVAQAEGYVLDVDADGVRIVSRDAGGLFYGAISAWQLLTSDATKGRVAVPFLHVADWPRFAWRGLMLDSARHFQSPDDIKVILDAMAQHKLNVFHWHLTDDQGWRLQIRRYPKLTEVGAWRKPPGPLSESAAAIYGGYYTQTQVRDIVAYAAARHITVVPEIDMPGHAQAAVAAYPDIGVTGERPAVSVDWGVNPYLFNVDEHTITFLHNVLDEVMELFPSTFVHVGGDEAIKDQWQAAPAVQARMRALGIKDEKALQSWFIERMGVYLAQHGRRLIGWDEILEGGLPPSASVMSWRGIQGAIDAARLGHDVVLSPAPTLYFDNLQSHRGDEPSGRLGVQSLADVYGFETMPPGIPAEQAKHVLGAQANVWTEYLTAPWQIQHALFPRMDALAEAVWTPLGGRDFGHFVERLPAQFGRYRQLGLQYADSAFAVSIDGQLDTSSQNKARITLSTQVPVPVLRYTTDGSAPGPASPEYRKAIDLPLPVTVTAIPFAADGRPMAAARTQRIDRNTLASVDSAHLAACPDSDLGLRVPLLPDATAAAPVYNIDVMNSCWQVRNVRLDGIESVVIDGAWLARNYGLAHDAAKVVARASRTANGEFDIHLDRCDGPLLASLPLPGRAEPGTPFQATSVLPGRAGTHDLCILSTAPVRGALAAPGRISFGARSSSPETP